MKKHLCRGIQGQIRLFRGALLLLGLGALLFSSSAFSFATPADVATPAGKISALEGRAKATSATGVERKIEVGDEVFMGDSLNTGRGSKLEVKFNDDTTILIGERAKLVINEFVYKPGDKESKLTTTLDRGVFKVIGGAIGKLAPDQTKVITPTATIGIRGTECVGLASAKSLTAIFTEGHAISVTNTKGQTILTGEVNFGCETLLGEQPGAPRKFSLSEINRITHGMAMRVIQTSVGANAAGVGARAGAVGGHRSH